MNRYYDLLVVGAGPTAIAIGAEAKRRGLDALLVDRGPLCAAIYNFPTHMGFFTTHDKLEIAGVPFAIPEDKPSRRQALVYYYQGVARRDRLRLALYQDVEAIERRGELFVIKSRDTRCFAATRNSRGSRGSAVAPGAVRVRRARAVALATGYFDQPQTLGVPGEDLPWIHRRYREPYSHYGQRVVIGGGGNSAGEAASTCGATTWR